MDVRRWDRVAFVPCETKTLYFNLTPITDNRCEKVGPGRREIRTLYFNLTQIIDNGCEVGPGRLLCPEKQEHCILI